MVKILKHWRRNLKKTEDGSHPCSWDNTISSMKIATPSEARYRLNENLAQISMTSITQIRKMLLKFVGKHEIPQIAQESTTMISIYTEPQSEK